MAMSSSSQMHLGIRSVPRAGMDLINHIRG